MADSYERFKNLSKVEQDRVYKWLADNNPEKIRLDKLKEAFAKETQANKARAYKRPFESLSKPQKIEKIKRGIGAKEYQKFIEAGTRGLSSTSIKWLKGLVGGPIGVLGTLLLSATPAGQPDELKRLRRAEKALERRKRAGDRPGAPGGKRGGGKIKKNYAKGGSVRPASY